MDEIETGERKVLADVELAQLVANGEATILEGRRGERSLPQQMVDGDFGSQRDNIKDGARRRHRYLSELAKRGVVAFVRGETEKFIAEIARELNDSNPPSYASVCRWRKKVGRSGDIRRLIDRRHYKEGRLRLQKDVQDEIDRLIGTHYMTSPPPTIQATYDKVGNKIDEINLTRDEHSRLSKPSYFAVRAAINRIDEYDLVASRHGKAAANARFAPVGNCPLPDYPMQVAELDHTKMDLMVVDDKHFLPMGRPWVVVLIDRRTRMPLGVHVSFDPPSFQTVAQCLKNAFLPKDYVKKLYPDIRNEWPCFGIPEWIVFDRAMENVGNDMDDMAATVGFNVEFCPAKKPWFKGKVERFFKTLNKRLLHKIPGTTFSNIIERGDYDPSKGAVISYNELLHMVHKWLVDDYAQSPHRGIGRVPAKLWDEEIMQNPVRPVTNRKDIDASIGCVETRVLSRNGIELENLRYQNEEIVYWLRDNAFKNASTETKSGYEVKIKYDPTDISRLWVYDPRNGRYVEMPCLDQAYAKGISIWQHRNIKAYLRNNLKKEVDLVGLQRARAELEDMVREALGRKRRRRTSTVANAARYAGVGRTAPAGDEVPQSGGVYPRLPTTPHSHQSPQRGGLSADHQPRNKPAAGRGRNPSVIPAMSSDSIDVYADI